MRELKYFVSVLLVAVGVLLVAVQSVLSYTELADLSARAGSPSITAARFDAARLRLSVMIGAPQKALYREAEYLAAHRSTIAAMRATGALDSEADGALGRAHAAFRGIDATLAEAAERAEPLDKWRLASVIEDLERALGRLEAIAVRVESAARLAVAKRARTFAWLSMAAIGAVGAFAIALISRRLILARELEDRNRALQAAHAVADHEARHDALTGLANRRYLEERLNRLSGAPAAAVVLDLDHFKHVNDTRGHAVGDMVLRKAAEILRDAAEPDDFIARTGGDEFVLLRAGDATEAELQALARRVAQRMAAVDSIGGQPCRLGASFGAAITDGKDAPTEDAVVNADLALTHAKRGGRGRCHVMSSRDVTAIRERKALADEIRLALENNAFEPYYQLQFDARTLDVVGVEALARWRHPTRGVLTPFHFLEAAEELGLVADLDSAILRRAAQDLPRFVAAGFSPPRISVNVSAKRLTEDGLLAEIAALGLPRGALSFELLETVYLDSRGDQVAGVIAGLKAAGVAIEIDDFGTGHASIGGLLNLGPDRLKIDRRFVLPILEDRRAARLLKSMIEIGEALEIDVVAEGVETPAHVEVLRRMGCDVLQGFGLARPEPIETVERTLAAQAWRAAS